MTAVPQLFPLLDSVPAPSEVKPGWIALVIVLLLGAAMVLLWLSMRRQISKIHFDEDATSTRRGQAPPPRG
jgi:hypothetical protein